MSDSIDFGPFLRSYPWLKTLPGQDFRIPAEKFTAHQLNSFIERINKKLGTAYIAHEYEDDSFQIWHDPVGSTEIWETCDLVVIQGKIDDCDYQTAKETTKGVRRDLATMRVAGLLKFFSMNIRQWNRMTLTQRITLRRLNKHRLGADLNRLMKDDEERLIRSTIANWTPEARERRLRWQGRSLVEWNNMTTKQQIEDYRKMEEKITKWKLKGVGE